MKIGLFLICLLPLLRLLGLGFSDNLGANPLEFITRSTGTWALVALMLTLSITPLRLFTGWNSVIRFRRMLGLFAFFYAALHLTTFVWFDHWFSLSAIIKDVIKRPFVTIGFASFLLMLPLALTSNHMAIRRLGRRWSLLHRLVYPVAILAVVHYWWLVKRDLTQPIIYGCVLFALLLARPAGRSYLRRQAALKRK